MIHIKNRPIVKIFIFNIPSEDSMLLLILIL